MMVAGRRIHESELQLVLRQAAAESMATTAEYCVNRARRGLPYGAIRLEEDLAWIAARATERGWDLLPADAIDAQVPIACAVQEIIEWAEHLVRLETVGDASCRGPLTWLPEGPHPLGTRDLAVAVVARAELLSSELAEHDVVVVPDEKMEVAA